MKGAILSKQWETKKNEKVPLCCRKRCGPLRWLTKKIGPKSESQTLIDSLAIVIDSHFEELCMTLTVKLWQCVIMVNDFTVATVFLNNRCFCKHQPRIYDTLYKNRGAIRLRLALRSTCYKTAAFTLTVCSQISEKVLPTILLQILKAAILKFKVVTCIGNHL